MEHEEKEIIISMIGKTVTSAEVKDHGVTILLTFTDGSWVTINTSEWFNIEAG